MAADELQVHLKAKDDLTRELTNAIKNVAKLESKLRDMGDATSPEAERDVARLTKQLDKAYDRSRTLTGAVDHLDTSLEQMGASASEAGRKTSAMGRDMDKAHNQGKTMAAGWGKIIGVAAGVTAAIGATAGAFRFLGDSINEARDARKAMAQTAAVMRSMGRAEAPKAINKMVDRLEAMSGIDGDNLRVMTNLMLTFGNVTEDTFFRANELALDLSVSMGKDLSSSTIMVGKALNDPIKGLTSLQRVGVSFTAQQTKQIKAQMAAGEVSKAQKVILRELTREVGGSAEAQADAIQKAQVAYKNFKEAIGEPILSGGMGGIDFADRINQATKWIKKNKKPIVDALMTMAAGAIRFGQFATVAFAGATYALAALQVTFEPVFALMSLLPGPIGRAGKALQGSSLKMFEAANKALELGDNMGTLADKAFGARDGVRELNLQLDAIKNKRVRAKVEVAIVTAQSAVDAAVAKAQRAADRQANLPGGNFGDTSTPMGVGGPLNLAAAHAAFSGSLNGHRITSGVRSWGLGSARSDHLRGRAMDVKGPHLGSYANAVRAAGGYAALHGQGANRHLHVVPRTHRPQAEMVGGDTLHAEVHFHGGNPRPFDARQAVISGLREAERRKRQRG